LKAIVFDGELRAVRDHPAPEALANEALVKVLLAGICDTDLEITRGYMGFRGVLGHEFVGVVEKARDRHLIGQRVVGEINCGCGLCGYCLAGLRSHCPGRKVLGISGKDGALAEYLSLPLENLHTVPENVPDEEAVFTEPLAAAFEITEQVHVRPTDRVLVMGDGKLGLLAAMVLGLSSNDVSLLGKHEHKLGIARARNIKTMLLGDLPLGDLKKRKIYDTVVEATGSAGGLELAMGLVKPRGNIVLKSTVAEGKEMNLAPLVIDEVTVTGSRCGPFGPALGALARGLVEVRPLITGIFPFERAEEAFKKAGQRGSLKVLVDFR
jgi:threonine dehydrogenase-like Zn-dependent dehydrogenase